MIHLISYIMYNLQLGLTGVQPGVDPRVTARVAHGRCNEQVQGTRLIATIDDRPGELTVVGESTLLVPYPGTVSRVRGTIRWFDAPAGTPIETRLSPVRACTRSCKRTRRVKSSFHRFSSVLRRPGALTVIGETTLYAAVAYNRWHSVAPAVAYIRWHSVAPAGYLESFKC